jgi:hypothetical protein
METLDLAYVLSCQIVVDDVSDGQQTEFRCSVYDRDGVLTFESWGITVEESIANAFLGGEINNG